MIRFRPIFASGCGPRLMASSTACSADVQRAFVSRTGAADEGGDDGVILPGYTHLQRAQPVLANHYWLAYCEKYERDIASGLLDCRRRVNRLPLGTAAMAGTTIPIDRQRVADELEFDGLVANSLDSSSDRDFAIEFVGCLAQIAIHLSGWAEEWILWSTTEFNFLTLPRAFCTGSVDHAAEDQPGCAGVDPREERPRRRRAAEPAGADQGPAAGLQPRPARRQRAECSTPPTRCVGVPGAGGADRWHGATLNREAIEAERLDRGYLDATTLHGALDPHRRATADGPRADRPAGGRRDAEVASGSPTCRSRSSAPRTKSLDESVYDVLGVDRAVAAFKSVGSTNPAPRRRAGRRVARAAAS